MTEKYLCAKSRTTLDGEVSFKKGNTYYFTKLPNKFAMSLSEQGFETVIYESDMTRYFVKVSDVSNLQENNMEQTQETFLSEAQLEAKIVKEWFNKVNWLTANTEVSSWSRLEVVTEMGGVLYNEDCVDFVINSYNAYKAKEKEKEKQKLLDKKAELELQLAEINQRLGE